MPRINNRLVDAITFARFCIGHKIEPADAAELVALARSAFRAGERETSDYQLSATRRAANACKAFERKAESLGFKVDWPGLWPRLIGKNGHTYNVPPVGD